jgi:sulfonate transport system substrate-binding protein
MEGELMNNRLLVVLIFALIVCVCILVVSFFGENHAVQATQKKIIVGSFSKTIAYAPVYVAMENGWLNEAFAKNDLNFGFVEFQALPAINEAFATKNADIVFEAEIPASIGKAAGVDIMIAGLTGKYYQELVIPSDSTIASYADLKGKTIIAQSGTSSHYSLAKMLEQSGLSMKDIQMVDMPPADGKAAFDSNQAAAWAVWPPFVQQEQLFGNVKTIKGKDISAIIAVRGNFEKENKQLVSDVIAAISRAKKWMNENPEKAQEIVSKKLKLDISVVKKAWAVHDFNSELSNTDVQDIQSKADFLLDLKIIKNKINAAEFVETKN